MHAAFLVSSLKGSKGSRGESGSPGQPRKTDVCEGKEQGADLHLHGRLGGETNKTKEGSCQAALYQLGPQRATRCSTGFLCEATPPSQQAVAQRLPGKPQVEKIDRNNPIPPHKGQRPLHLLGSPFTHLACKPPCPGWATTGTHRDSVLSSHGFQRSRETLPWR